ncbi:uncharacterized protein [Diadema setosum]|uniref:uncharacterized protein n=1 Tax=Diadema setosum TaxID=31175 RepID=UPI003B3A3451
MNDTPSVDSEKTNTAPSASTMQDVPAEDKEGLVFPALGLRGERLTQAAHPQEKNLTSHISSDAYNPDSFSETLGAPHHVSQKRMKLNKHQSKFQLRGHKHSFQREKCKVCMNFVLNHNMHDHMRVHNGEKPFQCKVCSRCFSQKSSLKRHMSLHDPKHLYARKPFQCKVCSRFFTQQGSLNRHMSLHDPKHFNARKPFQCKVCSRCFTQQGSLNRHMSLHDPKHFYARKPFQCKVCSRCFTQQGSLNRHMSLHDPKHFYARKPFQCKVCSRCFTQQGSLNRHMSLHDPKHFYARKPFQCKVCSRCFTQQGSLNRHMSLHNPKHINVREQCKVCGKSVSKVYMRVHIRLHKGEKPFRCKVCSRCFTQKSSLKQHMSLLGHMHQCDTTNPNLFSKTVRSTSLDLIVKEEDEIT